MNGNKGGTLGKVGGILQNWAAVPRDFQDGYGWNERNFWRVTEDAAG